MINGTVVFFTGSMNKLKFGNWKDRFCLVNFGLYQNQKIVHEGTS